MRLTSSIPSVVEVCVTEDKTNIFRKITRSVNYLFCCLKLVTNNLDGSMQAGHTINSGRKALKMPVVLQHGLFVLCPNG